MIQQDYFIRVIQEFMQALSLVINSQRDVKRKQEELQKLYDTYLGDAVMLHTASMEELMTFFSEFPEEQRLDRMEMLAQLLYVESTLKTGPARTLLLERALPLFRFIDSHSDTFSFERQTKIAEIERKLG